MENTSSLQINEKNVPKLVFFEGIPASGKTTLINYLTQKFQFCRSFTEVIDEKGQPFPWSHFKGKSQAFFNRSDVRKIKLALSLNVPIVLLDRGYASTISHTFIEYFFFKRKRKVIATINFFKKELSILKNLDVYYIFLSNNPKSSQNRKKLPKGDIWENKERLKATQLFYSIFFFNRPNVFTIDVSSNSLPQVKKECEKILLKIKKS